jgi:hypothetical protein
MARGYSQSGSESQRNLRDSYNSTLPARELPEGHTVAKPAAFMPGSAINREGEVNKPPYNDPQVSGKIYVSPYSAENLGSMGFRMDLMTREEKRELDNVISASRKTNPGLGGATKEGVMGIAAVAVSFDVFKKINAAKIDLLKKVDKAREGNETALFKTAAALKSLGFGEYSTEAKLLDSPVSPYKTFRLKDEPTSKSQNAAKTLKSRRAEQRAYESDPRQFMTYRNGQWMIAD